MKVSMTSGIAFRTIGSHDETARVTSREFKFRGKTVTMTLTAPYVRNDGNEFDFGAAWVLDGIYDPKTMTEPQQVRGFYANAEFEITGLGFPTIKLTTGVERDADGKSFIVIKSFTATGNADQSRAGVTARANSCLCVTTIGRFRNGVPRELSQVTHRRRQELHAIRRKR
jgi:hypothetical protein